MSELLSELLSDEQLEAERLECVATVDAARLEADRKAAEKREADKLRKRQERAQAKAIRDRSDAAQQAQLEKEKASKRAKQIESERKALLIQELQPECLAEPDTECLDVDENPIPGTSWKQYVQNELDLFLRSLEQLDFETLYWRLTQTEVGKLVLNMFGVELPARLPAGWLWASICGETVATRSPSYLPRLAVWEFSTPDELIAAGEQHDKMYPQGAHNQTRQTPAIDNDNYGLIRRSVEQTLADIDAKNARLKKVYQERMSRLRATYVEARKKFSQDYKAPELKIDPPPTPPTPQPEPLSEPQQPRFGGFFESKRSDWTEAK